jgi:transcriptional regulator with XRE-family HTH domain
MSHKTYENIRKIREMNDLTREYVAGELQMSTSGYGKIERGEIDLTLSKLYKIAAIFNVSITDLLFFDISFFFKNAPRTDSDKRSLPVSAISFNKERIFELEKDNLLLKNRINIKI